MVAGAPSAGLLAMRSPVDGTGLAAKFKYITKIISRPSGLYVFDYDSLRKYDYTSKVNITGSLISRFTANLFQILFYLLGILSVGHVDKI